MHGHGRNDLGTGSLLRLHTAKTKGRKSIEIKHVKCSFLRGLVQVNDTLNSFCSHAGLYILTHGLIVDLIFIIASVFLSLVPKHMNKYCQTLLIWWITFTHHVSNSSLLRSIRPFLHRK